MTVRSKMSREERAKQFMPFAALKGYPEELRKREKIIVPRMELTEDHAEELDRKFREIREKDIVTAVYFCKGEYLKVTGMVAKLDVDSRYIKIVNTKIPLDDLFEIEIFPK
ncbi:MAG: YolD-like family protein [Eubacteriales bacterium]|nr:YolD-like family protein [Eubacteriales bacterium]